MPRAFPPSLSGRSWEDRGLAPVRLATVLGLVVDLPKTCPSRNVQTRRDSAPITMRQSFYFAVTLDQRHPFVSPR